MKQSKEPKLLQRNSIKNQKIPSQISADVFTFDDSKAVQTDRDFMDDSEQNIQAWMRLVTTRKGRINPRGANQKALCTTYFTK